MFKRFIFPIAGIIIAFAIGITAGIKMNSRNAGGQLTTNTSAPGEKYQKNNLIIFNIRVV